MKLCCRLLIICCLNVCEKRQIWVSEPNFGEVRGDTLPWLMAHWKAHSQLSIRVNWTFFAIYYGCGVMRRNVYSLAVFAGGRLLCTKILPGQSHTPSISLGTRKLETPGYLMMKTTSLWVPWFWHNTAVWRTDRLTDRQADIQTDGRICRNIYSACKASFCKNATKYIFLSSC